jgi:hypothetical protein
VRRWGRVNKGWSLGRGKVIQERGDLSKEGERAEHEKLEVTSSGDPSPSHQPPPCGLYDEEELFEFLFFRRQEKLTELSALSCKLTAAENVVYPVFTRPLSGGVDRPDQKR